MSEKIIVGLFVAFLLLQFGCLSYVAINAPLPTSEDIK